MSRKYKFHDLDSLYFITSTTVNWVDVFIRDVYREIILNSIKYCQKEKGLDVYSWCLMTSHLHMIVGSHKSPLDDIIRDFKSFTSYELKSAITFNETESRKEWMLPIFIEAGRRNFNNVKWQFWQQNNHPIVLDTNESFDNTLNYIHMNPVEAGFVSGAQYYPFSSAIDYSGGKGLLDVIVVD